MIYDDICSAKFISRPNRFIAEVDIEGKIEIVHVKNTGRCKELLVPGSILYLQKSNHIARKTKYDIIAVQKSTGCANSKRLINMDSHAPNKVFTEFLQSGKYIENIKLIKPETTFGKSRFDFYIEVENRRIFIEVKGVTLEENGVVMFPDAPTERGVKHVYELIECVKSGYEAQIVFVVQMDNVRYFTPNINTHAAFGEALNAAENAGVKIVAVDCKVTENSMNINDFVEVKLVRHSV